MSAWTATIWSLRNLSITREQASDLIAARVEQKTQRQDALKAFGFETDPMNGQAVRIVNSRTLHMDKITAKLRTDIPGFLKRYFDFPNSDFPEASGTVPHVVSLLEEMFIGGRVMAMFSTDHAKSMSADKFFPILSLAENPDESHILVGANFNDTKRRLQVIQRVFEGGDELSERLLLDFPWLKKPKAAKEGGKGGTTWSRVEITVDGRTANRPDPSIYACAIGSSDIRGRRGKLIMDDIEGVRNSKYALTRQELYEFVKLEATRCWEDTSESRRPLLIALGTPFDPDSIYLKLEQEDWRVSKVPAYTVPYTKIQDSDYMKGSTTETPWQDRAALLPDRYFTWPRKRYKVTGADPLFGKGLSKSQFAIQYLLDPTEGKPGRLSVKQMADLITDKGGADDKDWATFITLDPASGVKTRNSDYAGIAVVRIRWPQSEKLPDVQVLEAHKFEQGIIEQVRFCGELKDKYGCAVMYEGNSQQRGTYHSNFSHFRPDLRLVPVYTTDANKFDTEMGLTVIRTLIQNSKLKAPASQVESEGMQAMLSEVRDLGSGERHDHICSAVWFVVKWLYEQVRGKNGPAVVAVVARSWGGHAGMSWGTWRR